MTGEALADLEDWSMVRVEVSGGSEHSLAEVAAMATIMLCKVASLEGSDLLPERLREVRVPIRITE